MRDFALTCAMWAVLAIMLATEFEHLGLGDFDTNPHWGALLPPSRTLALADQSAFAPTARLLR